MNLTVPLAILIPMAGLIVGFASLAVAVFRLYGMRIDEAKEHGKLIKTVEDLVEDVRSLTVDNKTLWQALYRRGQVEAMQKGWGEFRSPFHITNVSFEVVLPFITAFLPWYAQMRKLHPDWGDSEYMVALEQRFGDFIIEKICVPQQVTSFACLVAILEVCKHEHSSGR